MARIHVEVRLMEQRGSTYYFHVDCIAYNGTIALNPRIFDCRADPPISDGYFKTQLGVAIDQYLERNGGIPPEDMAFSYSSADF